MSKIRNTVAGLSKTAQAVIDDYDVQAWETFYKANPRFLRSVGADTAEKEEESEGESEEESEDSKEIEESSKSKGEEESSEESISDWRDNISDSNERKFADQFTTPGEAVTFAFKSRKQLSNAVSIPAKDADEETVNAFWSKLGTPEDPSGYAFTMPEGQEASENDVAFQAALGKMFYTAKLTKAQADVLNIGYNELTLNVIEEQKTRATEARQKSEDELKQVWGDDYEANLAHSKRTISAFGDAEYRKFLDETMVDGDQLGSHPMMNKIHALIGRRLGEGTINLAMTDSEKSDGEDHRSELTREIHAAQSAGDTAKANRLIRERGDLTVKLHGTQPI
jgi:hypothetical protein